MNIRMILAAIVTGAVLSACGSPGPVTVVEKEYEPGGFGTHSKCVKKDKKGKCTKKKTEMKYENECFEIDWSNGDEECVSRERFDLLQVGSVR